ncbi:MAG: AAA family ATPase [Candidatus Woesearchaeota archaeon]
MKTEKPILYILRGLPASGKTTWAKKKIEIDKEENKLTGDKLETVRVSKDDLRDMLDNGKFSKGKEKHIEKIQDEIIQYYIKQGKNVIVDNTHLPDKWIEHFKNNFTNIVENIEIIDFTDVDVETCIKRDLKRGEKVGEKVIRDMYRNHIEQKPTYKEYDINLEDCIICDIDGTLAHRNNRNPFDYYRVIYDSVDVFVKSILEKYKDTHHIILVSGREDYCREQTIEWLNYHNIKFYKLYMRSSVDYRSDYVVKKELYEKYVKDKYNVSFVLDDRKQVVDMWRSIGLKCLQVEEGNF